MAIWISFLADCSPDQLLYNDGSGHFHKVTTFGEPNAHIEGIARVDMDKDGDLDNLVTHRGDPTYLTLWNRVLSHLETIWRTKGPYH